MNFFFILALKMRIYSKKTPCISQVTHLLDLLKLIQLSHHHDHHHHHLQYFFCNHHHHQPDHQYHKYILVIIIT